MVSNSIYPSFQELQLFLSQNPDLSNQLVQTYLSTRTGNPSVTNMKFRQLLETAGFNYHKQGYSPKEIAYRIQNNDWGYHYCHSCGKEISSFHSFETGFTRHCCAKCCGKNPATYEERKKFNQKNYGVDNVFQAAVVKKKMADTCQKKYAANRYQQTAEFSAKMTATAAKRTKETRDEITEKRKATNIEKFGFEFPLQSLEIRQKLKDTCMKTYGVDNPQKSTLVRKKAESTCLERFGVKNSLLSGIIQQKVKATLQKNYSVDNPGQSDIIKERIKATNLERYGVEYPGQSDIIKERMRATNLERYGVEYPWQSDIIQERIKATNLERYGVEYPGQSDIIKERMRATNLERYGVEYPGQSDIIKERMRATNLARYGVEYYAQCSEFSDKMYNNSNKPYNLPSGKIIQIQGYENYAIDELLSTGYLESELLLVHRPAVKYFWSSDDGHGDNKWHYYHPDIVIPAENRIIEVKSGWTYDGNGTNLKLLSRNLAKEKGAVIAGYSFTFKVF